VDARHKAGHDVEAQCLSFVMAGLSRPSTSLSLQIREDVDARHKAGHDGKKSGRR
jgi:hypothetical protein